MCKCVQGSRTEIARALGEWQGADKHMYSPVTTLPQWQGRRKKKTHLCGNHCPSARHRFLHPVGKQGFFLDCCLLALFQHSHEADMDKCHMHGLNFVASESRSRGVTWRLPVSSPACSGQDGAGQVSWRGGNTLGSAQVGSISSWYPTRHGIWEMAKHLHKHLSFSKGWNGVRHIPQQ